MTFSSRLKEEITEYDGNLIEKRAELSSILRYDAKIEKDKITITCENAKIARRIYKNLKEVFGINIKIIIRNQKRFRVKQIYILEIKEKINYILESLYIYNNGKKIKANEEYFEAYEEKVAYIKGAFLATGSVNDPSTSGYHFEFVFPTKTDAEFIKKILKSIRFESKILKRNNRYMVYIKSAEEISDVIKLFNAINSLFYFEDIRIYRDHKNMVNRLNNCEIANQEKSTSTGMKQVSDIEFLKENDLLDLLDEHTKIVLEYRYKYPESSYLELADIISLETDYKIGKSGINHHFIKMKKLIEKYKNK
jgi:hypothetical protein